jgi:hypothetical protein
MVKISNLFLIIILAFSLITLLGCVEQDTQIPGLPYTTGQLINRSTDLDLNTFFLGGYDGMLVVVDGNKLSVADTNDLNIALPIDTNNLVPYTNADKNINLNGVEVSNAGRVGVLTNAVNADFQVGDYTAPVFVDDVVADNVLISFNYGSGDYTAFGNYYAYSVYAYKIVGALKLFSPNGAYTENSDDASEEEYTITLNWDSVSDADGYRVIVQNDDYSSSYGDYYFDTNDTSVLINGGDIYVYGSDVSPASPLYYNNYTLFADTNLQEVNVYNFRIKDIPLTNSGQDTLSFGLNASNNSSNQYSNYFGNGAGYNSTGTSYSNYFGLNAGSNAVNGSSSNYFGVGAGENSNGSTGNNSFGYNAGSRSINGYNSNFFGNSAGMDSNGAYQCNFLGDATGQNVQANNSNFIGYYAGYGATNASNSNFFGYRAGYKASSADMSNFFGFNAGYGATGANRSAFIGRYAGFNATFANNSSFIGAGAGVNATNANSSTFIGTNTGTQANKASSSVFLGNSAGANATNANASTFIGFNAGANATNANKSIFIGYSAGLDDTVNNSSSGYSIVLGNYAGTGGYKDSISIGTGTKNSATQQLNLGNVLYANGIYNSIIQSSIPTSAGKVGIGLNSPSERLDVNGNEKITGNLYLIGNGYLYDNNKLYLGDAQDASIKYDGTRLVINPKEVGDGTLYIDGIIQSNEYYSKDTAQGLTGINIGERSNWNGIMHEEEPFFGVTLGDNPVINIDTKDANGDYWGTAKIGLKGKPYSNWDLIVYGDTNITRNLNVDGNYKVTGVTGITKNITIMKTALTTCDMNFKGGILIGSTC